jgi:hypothetical protein
MVFSFPIFIDGSALIRTGARFCQIILYIERREDQDYGYIAKGYIYLALLSRIFCADVSNLDVAQSDRTLCGRVAKMAAIQ